MVTFEINTRLSQSALLSVEGHQNTTYLKHLMKNDICHPVIAVYINCQTMRHVEHVVPPTILYISGLRVENDNGFRRNGSLLNDIVVACVGVPNSFASMEDYWIAHRIYGNRCNLTEFMLRLRPVLNQNWLWDTRLLGIKVLERWIRIIFKIWDIQNM